MKLYKYSWQDEYDTRGNWRGIVINGESRFTEHTKSNREYS